MSPHELPTRPAQAALEHMAALGLQPLNVMTLLVVAVVVHLLSASLLLGVRSQTHRRAGLGLWATSDLVYAAGFMLILARHLVPEALSITGGNLVLDVGTAMAYVAAMQFLRWPRLWMWPLVVAGVLWLYEIAGALLGHGYREQVIVGCLLRSLLMGAAAWQLLRNAPRDVRPASSVAAIYYIAWMVVLLSRMTWWLLFHEPLVPPVTDPTTPYALLARIGLAFLIAPSYLWMVSRQLDAQLMREARVDSLTGLANRRALWEQGAAATARVRRGGLPITVMVLDIDHFKNINDSWGHAVGDTVLTAVGNTLASTVRSSDLVTRIGGEEFALLLPDTPVKAARHLAERLRAAIAQIQVPARPGTGPQVGCTVSIGIAGQGTGEARSWEELVARADDALYAAKARGRDCVVTEDEAAA